VNVEVRVQTQDFSLDDEWAACRGRTAGQAGAIVAFGGLVREFSQHDSVQALLLEHYPGMTETSMRAIAEDAGSRWPLLDVVIVHRVGELHAADQIVLVIVASTHRTTAFAACEFIMDYLKTRAIFWKKERNSDGGTWIRSTADDQARARNYDL
jgi:molybdopterin synthase catalytic subunit